MESFPAIVAHDPENLMWCVEERGANGASTLYEVGFDSNPIKLTNSDQTFLIPPEESKNRTIAEVSKIPQYDSPDYIHDVQVASLLEVIDIPDKYGRPLCLVRHFGNEDEKESLFPITCLKFYDVV